LSEKRLYLLTCYTSALAIWLFEFCPVVWLVRWQAKGNVPNERKVLKTKNAGRQKIKLFHILYLVQLSILQDGQSLGLLFSHMFVFALSLSCCTVFLALVVT
jgi:hypothetical protein